MSTVLERWPRPLELRALAALLGVAIFALSWTALHHGVFARRQIPDTPLYQSYGNAMVDGAVPYRDIRLEYPPGALPTFLVPAIGHPSQTDYTRRFGWIMLACGVAMLALMAVALWALGAGPRRLFGALVFAGLAPLALGSLVLTRFDLWPAAITAAAVAALLAGRERLGTGLIGLGFAVKLYPGLLLPLALAHVWKRRGRRQALVCAGIFAAVAAVVFVPFLVLSPGGVWNSVFRQGSRPLQIESLGSALLLAAHHLWGQGVTMHSSHGSQNLVGSGPNALAALQSVVQAVVIVALWVWYAHGEPSRERLVRSSATVVVAFVALGKVLSPQFLIWLVPLVPLVRGRRGLVASGLLALALVLTQLWFPYRYWDLALHFGTTPSWLVLARDLVLVALLAALTLPRRAGSPHSP
jgi:hypothetical protein